MARISFELELAGDRIEARISALAAESDERLRVQAMVMEMLPLDTERRAECEVWLAFTARALALGQRHRGSSPRRPRPTEGPRRGRPMSATPIGEPRCRHA